MVGRFWEFLDSKIINSRNMLFGGFLVIFTQNCTHSGCPLVIFQMYQKSSCYNCSSIYHMPLRNSCIKNHIAKASCLKFFFFFGSPRSTSILGQGSDPRHSCNLCRSCSTGSFNPLLWARDWICVRALLRHRRSSCTTVGIPKTLFDCIPSFMLLTRCLLSNRIITLLFFSFLW